MMHTDKRQLTKNNIIIFILAIIFLIYSILNGLLNAQDILIKKKERFVAMSIDALGAYIVSKNNYTNHIDMITAIRPITYAHNSLEIIYDVKKGFLQSIVSTIVETDKIKEHLKEDLRVENCTKTAHRTFLEKGGIISYCYYLQEKDTNVFLFDFYIEEKDCKPYNPKDLLFL